MPSTKSKFVSPLSEILINYNELADRPYFLTNIPTVAKMRQQH